MRFQPHCVSELLKFKSSEVPMRQSSCDVIVAKRFPWIELQLRESIYQSLSSYPREMLIAPSSLSCRWPRYRIENIKMPDRWVKYPVDVKWRNYLRWSCLPSHKWRDIKAVRSYRSISSHTSWMNVDARPTERRPRYWTSSNSDSRNRDSGKLYLEASHHAERKSI